MPITSTSVKQTFARVVHLAIDDEKDLPDAASDSTFSPAIARIEFSRSGERASWRINVITVRGPRRLVSGSLGAREGELAFLWSERHMMPVWLRDAVQEAIVEAEGDRLGETTGGK